jgi:hypothetical protein
MPLDDAHLGDILFHAFRVRVGIVCLAVVTDFAHFKNALFDLILQKLTRRSFWHVGFFNEVAGYEFVAL